MKLNTLQQLSKILPSENFQHQKITPFQCLIDYISPEITIIGSTEGIGTTTLLIDMAIKMVQTGKSKGLLFIALKDNVSEIHTRFAENMTENLVDDNVADNIILTDNQPTEFIPLLNLIIDGISSGADTIIIDNLNHLLAKFNIVEVKSFFNFLKLTSTHSGIRFIVSDTMSDEIKKRTGFQNRMPSLSDISYHELRRISSKTFTLSRLTYYGMATNMDAFETINKMQVSIYDGEDYVDEITLELANFCSYKEKIDLP